MSVSFDRPEFLLLAPLVGLGLWLARRRSLTSWGTRQAAVCLALRFGVATLIVGALAGPRWVGATREVAVVFLRDVSASMNHPASRAPAPLREGFERSAEIDFAQEPRVVRGFGRREPVESEVPAETATNLGEALETAAASLPADRPGRIVVFSDGDWNAGRDPGEVAAALAARGVEIDVIPAAADERPDAGVASVSVPSGIRQGEVFDLPAVIHSRTALTGAVLRLFQNQLLAGELRQDLAPGDNAVVFRNVRATEGAALYEVEVAVPGDARAENDRQRAAVSHGGPARVLIADANPEQSDPLARVLRTAGFSVDVRPPPGFPQSLEDLRAFDLVIFADAPATAFSENQMKLVEGWVRDFGGGFVMTGGEDSFGAGGYFRTPISALLPVRIEREEREETPVVALLVILDRSGSMAAPAGGQTKMALANEGAGLALEVLQSKDLFGLFAVDTRVQDVVPLARIGDREAAARRIAGITAGGGGIYVYTALAEALPRLQAAEARIKHIILFSDAADAEEKNAGATGGGPTAGGSALDLAAAMLSQRITLSVVALGGDQDKDTAFLRQLAAQGGGRFYLTADATTLPRLFTLETMRATESSLREDAFFAVPQGHPDLVRGVDWKSAPLLLGLNVSRLKPGAELVLATERGDPLLAVWRFGLGRVAAFTSDAKARWASEWLAWPGYEKFWTQLARGLLPPSAEGGFDVRLKEEHDALMIEVEAVSPAGQFRDGLKLAAHLAAPGLPPRSVALDQTGPGAYRVRVEKPPADPVTIAVAEEGGAPVALAWTAGYPAEYRVSRNGTAVLESLAATTGGRVDPTPDAYFRPSSRPAPTRRDLAPWLLLAAALLWPVDVWMRRRPWPAPGENSLPPFSHAR